MNKILKKMLEKRAAANFRQNKEFEIQKVLTKDQKFRLPHGSTMMGTYDGEKELWTVIVTVGEHTFRAIEPSIHIAVLKAGQKAAIKFAIRSIRLDSNPSTGVK